MNDEQKQTIRELRLQGSTYRQIGDLLGLSMNTVKTFCIRNDVQIRVCKNCQKPLSEETKSKIKVFCSDYCRSDWWRQNSDQLNKKAMYSIICRHCKKEFESYGNKNRKFCSQSCYFASRYGVP